MAVVSVQNISKTYGSKKVLNDISFDINKGEVFGLLGSNGAGKSTITSIILGLEKKSSGQCILFDGDKTRNIKSRIALVSQEDSFYLNFTVNQNMYFFAALAGYYGARAKKRINFLLNWLHLDDFSLVVSENLSGGYRKLLNIAISIIHDPELIFFDEPTVGLDPKMRQIFWDKIIELKNANKTVILTTHYMDEAQRLCDRIVLLKKGKIIAIGSPEDLISEYGGIRIVMFKIVGGVSAKDILVLKELSGQPDLFCKGDYLFIPFKEEKIVGRVSAVNGYLMNKGYNIISSTTNEPTLEDVFLNIVGEKDD